MAISFNLCSLLKRNAYLYGNAEALIAEEKRYSYGNLLPRSSALAHTLSLEGIKSGDRIALLTDDGLDILFGLFAASQLGAMVVPLNTRLSEGEKAHLLKDTRPSLLCASAHYLDEAKRIAKAIKGLSVRRTEEMYSTQVFPPDPSSPPPADTPCLIIHTAAVGGKPRGAVLTQENLISTAVQIAHLLTLTEKDRHLCLLPLFHIGGIAFSLATTLVGGSTMLVRRFDAEAVPKMIEKEQLTFFITFPPMLSAILEAAERQGCHLPSLRLAGGVDSPENIERFLSAHPQALFYHIYGQTECMPISGGVYTQAGGSIGKPALLTEISIRDEEDRPLSPGERGEICVRSPSVFQGYWRLKGDSAYTFRGGWHHTGDLGEMGQDGTLFYRGRKPDKDLIKTGGENVYPREVEAVLLSHEAVKEACVIGVPDEKWGEAVVALCVLKEGRQVEESKLIEHVASRIARYKRPQRVLFIDALPKTLDGRIDRERVKMMGVELLIPPRKQN